MPGTCTFELQERIQGDSTLDMPTDGIGSDEEGPAPAKSKKTRGADKMASYTNRKRAAVVAELRELESDHADRIWRVYGMSCQKVLARKTGIAQSNICKWQQDEAKYIAADGDDLKKGLFKKGTERRWFREAEHALHSKLMERRKRKLRVSIAWIRVNAKKLVLEKYPDHPHARSFAASERWCRKFAKRHHLSKRRRSNMKNKSVEERLPQMMRFHRRLRRLLQQPPVRCPAAEGAVENDNAEVLSVQKPVCGRFSLDRRINIDQVGLAFVNGLESTWDETGAKRVQISQPFAGRETPMHRQRLFWTWS